MGKDLTVEEGYAAARLCALNSLANLKAGLGDLDKVTRIVKVLGMVNGEPDFTSHPAVINGYSDLMVELFGENGKHARSAVGMGGLPGGMAVEVEVIVESTTRGSRRSTLLAAPGGVALQRPKRLGILVGGGPAPGINSVISAATIEAVNSALKLSASTMASST